MKKWLLLPLLLLLALPAQSFAAVKAGASCTKAGTTSISAGKKFTCVLVKKKLIWNAGVAISPAVAPSTQPSATPTPSATPSPTPTIIQTAADSEEKIALTEGCHAKVEATLQKQDGATWVDVAKAEGWEHVNACNADQYRPYTTAKIAEGTVIRWKVYAPGAWEWFSGAVTYRKAVVVAPAILAKRQAIDALAVLPASSFKPTSPCQLVDQVTPNRSYAVDLSAGFPKIATRLKSSGVIKSLIVPLDFTDVPGKDDTVSYFSKIAKGVNDYWSAQSYGKVSFDFTINPSWVHMNFPITKYGIAGNVGSGDVQGYRIAVIAATDAQFDFASYDAVYFLVPKEMPMAVMGWGPAITAPYDVKGGYIINGATGGADMYFNENNGVIGGTWKWMAHETGHAFGLYDEDYKHESASLGDWGIMSQSWTNDVIEQNAWDRYLQGWLTDSQIGCTAKSDLASEKTFTINSLTSTGENQKAVMIPLSKSKILVLESRRKSSLDNYRNTQEGLHIFTVDMTIGQLGGGYVTIRRPGSTDSVFRDAALRQGDSVTVDGVTIKVTTASSSGDTVAISSK